jgi:hypothetical protein
MEAHIMKKILIIIVLLVLSMPATATEPDTLWTQHFMPDREITKMFFSHDDSLIVVIPNQAYGIGNDTTKVNPVVINTFTGQVIRELVGLNSPVINTASLSNNDIFIADGTLLGDKSMTDLNIKIWNIRTGRLLDSLTKYNFPEYTENFLNFEIKNFKFTPDGTKLLALVGERPEWDGKIKLDDVYFINTSNWETIRKDTTDHWFALDFLEISPDGRYYAGLSFDYTPLNSSWGFDVREINSDTSVHFFKSTGYKKFEDSRSLEDVVFFIFSPDSSKLLFRLDRDSIYNLSTFSFYKRLYFFNTYTMQFMNNSNYLIGDYPHICFYNITSDSIEYSYNNYKANEYCVSNSGRYILGYATTYDSLYLFYTILDITSVDRGFEDSPTLLYPNPSEDFIEISDINPMLKHGVEYSDIKIFNIFGQTVLSVGVQNFEPLRIDVSGLAPGMYFVRIGDRVSKFIKL